VTASWDQLPQLGCLFFDRFTGIIQHDVEFIDNRSAFADLAIGEGALLSQPVQAWTPPDAGAKMELASDINHFLRSIFEPSIGTCTNSCRDALTILLIGFPLCGSVFS